MRVYTNEHLVRIHLGSSHTLFLHWRCHHIDEMEGQLLFEWYRSWHILERKWNLFCCPASIGGTYIFPKHKKPHHCSNWLWRNISQSRNSRWWRAELPKHTRPFSSSLFSFQQRNYILLRMRIDIFRAFLWTYTIPLSTPTTSELRPLDFW